MYSNSYNKLYPEHIPTTRLQKNLLNVGSYISVMLGTTYSINNVSLIEQLTNINNLKKIMLKMLENNDGRRLISDKKRILHDQLDINRLIEKPTHSLGYHYGQFLMKNNINSNISSNVQFIDDIELAYIKQRYDDIHYFIHVIYGLPYLNLISKLAIQMLIYVQTGLPLCSLWSIMSLNLSKKEFYHLWSVYVPWAIYAGNRSKFVMNIPFEELLDKPIKSLEREFNIIIAPHPKDVLGFEPTTTTSNTTTATTTTTTTIHTHLNDSNFVE